jgi:hypothetical protein
MQLELASPKENPSDSRGNIGPKRPTRVRTLLRERINSALSADLVAAAPHCELHGG